MSIEKKTLEVLKAGLDDTLNLMDEEAMDFIAGGLCTPSYCSGTYCSGTYDPNPTPGATTPNPSNPPKPTCKCGPTCPCVTCGCEKK